MVLGVDASWTACLAGWNEVGVVRRRAGWQLRWRLYGQALGVQGSATEACRGPHIALGEDHIRHCIARSLSVSASSVGLGLLFFKGELARLQFGAPVLNYGARGVRLGHGICEITLCLRRGTLNIDDDRLSWVVVEHISRHLRLRRRVGFSLKDILKANTLEDMKLRQRHRPAHRS